MKYLHEPKGRSLLAALIAMVLALSACGGGAPSKKGGLIVPKYGTGTPGVQLTPGGDLETPAPLGTLPSRPGPNATVSVDPRTPLPDAAAFTRFVYTYTAGLKPAKLVVELSADGQAHGRFGPKTRSGVLPPAKMAEIRSALQASNFFALQDSYLPPRTCCDLPTYELEVVAPDGRSKTITILGKPPDALGPLVRAMSGIWQLLPDA